MVFHAPLASGSSGLPAAHSYDSVLVQPANLVTNNRQRQLWRIHLDAVQSQLQRAQLWIETSLSRATQVTAAIEEAAGRCCRGRYPTRHMLPRCGSDLPTAFTSLHPTPASRRSVHKKEKT